MSNDKVKHDAIMSQLKGLEVEETSEETTDVVDNAETATEDTTTDEVEEGAETTETVENEEGDEGTEGTEGTSILNYLTHKFGEVDVNTEGLEPDDIEVAERFIEAILPKRVEEKAVQVLKEYPEVEGLYNHLKQGYSVDSWNKVTAPDVYSTITIADDDIKVAEDIFRQANKLRGLSDKQIDRLVEAAKDDASLIEDGREELQFLQSVEKKQKENILLAEKEAYEATVKAQQEAWKQAEAMINKGAFAGITLPKAEADAFYSDFAYRGKEGKDATKVEKIWQDISLEEELAVNWFLVGLRDGKFKNGFTLKPSSNKPKVTVREKAKVAGNGNANAGDKTMSAAELQGFFQNRK